PTDEDGAFRFMTIKPGRVAGPDGKLQAPHIVVSVLMRGLLRRLVTRIYFPNEPANGEDFALNLVEDARRKTLIANAVSGRADEAEHHGLALGHETQWLEGAGALVVVFEQEAVDRERAEEFFRDGVVAAFGVPMAAIVTAA